MIPASSQQQTGLQEHELLNSVTDSQVQVTLAAQLALSSLGIDPAPEDSEYEKSQTYYDARIVIIIHNGYQSDHASIDERRIKLHHM